MSGLLDCKKGSVVSEFGHGNAEPLFKRKISLVLSVHHKTGNCVIANVMSIGKNSVNFSEKKVLVDEFDLLLNGD